MTESDLDLPAGWAGVSDEYQRKPRVAAYQHQPTEATAFLVTIADEGASPNQYRVRLSTVNIASKYVRHDYPVDGYDTRDAAFDAAESFVEHVHEHLQEGSISAGAPDGGGGDCVRRCDG